MSDWIWGFHAAQALLEEYPELALEVYLSHLEKPGNDDKAIETLARSHSLKAQKMSRVPKELEDKRHQGIFVRIKTFPTLSWGEYESEFRTLSQGAHQWAMLDGVQDPRNYGAILRSAAAFGVKGCFIRNRHQSPPSGLVAQASSGQIFRIPQIECVNFSPVLKEMKNNLVAVVALDSDGAKIGAEIKKIVQEKRSVLWLLGSEGKGLRENLREQADLVVKIPMEPSVESLNVSVAAAISFHQFYSGNAQF